MKFVVDLWLDGYESEEDMKEACIDFIKESLDFSASSVSVEVFRPTPLAPDGATHCPNCCNLCKHENCTETCPICNRHAGKA